MRNIKTAVIGTGFIGPAHIEALRRIGGIEVIAVTSGDDPGAKTVAEKYSISRVYNSWQEVIEDKDVEVIHNCTPNYLHYEINKSALLSGKHVISEKPLTVTSAESSELIKIAQEKNLVNAVNYNYRGYPLIQQAKKIIDKGEAGNIYYVHGNYLQDWLYYDTDYSWRLESGFSGNSRAVADIGTHWCDLLQFITSSKITKVFADLVTVHKTRKKPSGPVDTFKGKDENIIVDTNLLEIDTEDMGTVLLQFDNGSRGVFTVSQVSAGRKNHFWFEVDGSKKSLAWNQEEPNSLWIGYREQANMNLMKDPSLLDDEPRKFAHYPGGHPEGYPDGLKNIFMNIYEFIRAGKNPNKDFTPFPTFKDGDRENRIVEAILESHKIQQWIEVK